MEKPFLGVPPCASPPCVQPEIDLLSVKGEPRQNVNAEKLTHEPRPPWAVHVVKEGRPGQPVALFLH